MQRCRGGTGEQVRIHRKTAAHAGDQGADSAIDVASVSLVLGCDSWFHTLLPPGCGGNTHWGYEMKGDWRKDPVLGDEGYPSARELRRIKTWEIHSGQDLTELMDYVYARWAYREWGWRKASRLRVPWRGVNYQDRKRAQVRVYDISTAGWSGNESIIRALEANWTFWMLSWESVRRGGHYVFHIRENYG